MRFYVVLLVILSIFSPKLVAAQSSHGRVLSIDDSTAQGVIIQLEIKDQNSDQLRQVKVLTSSIPADIQLNSRVQLNIVPQNNSATPPYTNSEQLYYATALRLDNYGAGQQTDKTGVRARMKKSANSRSARSAAHRGKH